MLTPISQSGKTAQVKALLIKHGANRLSDIDPSEYESLLADAEVLANGDQGDLLANNNIREKVRTSGCAAHVSGGESGVFRAVTIASRKEFQHARS